MPLSSEVLLLLLAATATCYLLLVTKRSCRQQDALPPTPTCEPHQQQRHLPTAKHPATEGRTSARITTKSTCRQQNTMPLKDEQVPGFHGKMPNVTSETLLKLRVATCYLCTKRSRTQAPKAAGRSATATCEPPYHQKHLPTAKHHATEGRTSPRIARKDA